MGIHLAAQTIAFLQACLLGALLGAVYDVFRILRIAFSPRKVVVFVQDLLFFAICAVLSFLFLLTASDGTVRMFLLIGELIGAVLYHLTLGRLVIRAAGALIAAVRSVLRFFYRFMVLPIWRFCYFLVSLLLRPFQLAAALLKNNLLRMKFRLKYRRIVLYNHLTGQFHRKTRRENITHGPEHNSGKEEA